MKHWNLIASGIMAAVGIVFVLLGIYPNLHFGLIILGNIWLVGAILLAWK